MQLTLKAVSVAFDKGYIYNYIFTVHTAITLNFYNAYSYKIGYSMAPRRSKPKMITKFKLTYEIILVVGSIF